VDLAVFFNLGHFKKLLYITLHSGSSSNKPTSGQLKHSPKPDVISSLEIDERSASEIARLEVLCEAKTKELSELKRELSERIRWFEAMALVVKYFVAQVCSFVDIVRL